MFFSSLFDAIVRRAPNIEIISDVEPDLTYLVGSPSSQCGKAGAGNRGLGWDLGVTIRPESCRFSLLSDIEGQGQNIFRSRQ